MRQVLIVSRFALNNSAYIKCNHLKLNNIVVKQVSMFALDYMYIATSTHVILSVK